MKKPKTYEKLINLINPMDLDEILGFSGVNDKPGTEHWDLKRKYSDLVYNSFHRSFLNSEEKYNEWKSPRSMVRGDKMDDDFYVTLVKCIQDFYYWSHGFSHIHDSVYKRVVNVLEIDMKVLKDFREEVITKRSQKR